MRRPFALLFALSLAACATTTVPTSTPQPAPAPPMNAPAPPPSAGTSAPPTSLHWFRDSAERRGLSRQTYALASARLETAAAGLARGSWAVILDADETVIDNSQYQRELWLAGKSAFDETLWTDWVSRAAAPPLDGASEFLDLVHRLGGRIAIVTNRSLSSCDATRTNFTKQDLPFDVMLCKDKDGDKNPRFRAVEQGATALGPVKVILWVGDNIRDFPGLDQSARLDPARLAEFGTRFFLLPNPMYGSWESNPAE